MNPVIGAPTALWRHRQRNDMRYPIYASWRNGPNWQRQCSQSWGQDDNWTVSTTWRTHPSWASR